MASSNNNYHRYDRNDDYYNNSSQYSRSGGNRFEGRSQSSRYDETQFANTYEQDSHGSYSKNDFNQHQRGFPSSVRQNQFSQRPASDTPYQSQHEESYGKDNNTYNYRNQQFQETPVPERFEQQTGGNQKRFRESDNDYTQNKYIKHSSSDSKRQIHDGQSSDRFEPRREDTYSFNQKRNYQQGNEDTSHSYMQNRESRFEGTQREKQIEDRSIGYESNYQQIKEEGGSDAGRYSSDRGRHDQFTGQFGVAGGPHYKDIREETGHREDYSSDWQEHKRHESNYSQMAENASNFPQFGRFSSATGSFGRQDSRNIGTTFNREPPMYSGRDDFQFYQRRGRGNRRPFSRPHSTSIHESRNTNAIKVEEESFTSDDLDEDDTNINDPKETEEDHDEVANSDDEGSSCYKKNLLVLDQAVIEKYKYYPPSALELSKIFEGFVIMYFYKPRASAEKNPFVVLCESFRRSESFGPISVEDGYLMGDKFIKFCTLRYSGMMLVRGVGQYGNQKEPRVRAGLELINKLAQYCYTLKMKESYFDAKHFNKILMNRTTEYYRFVPTNEVYNLETACKYVDNYIKEDTDQELIFEFDDNYKLKNYLRTKGCMYRFPSAKGDFVIVSKSRSPQYLRDKMLAKGEMENDMYLLIPPQGEGVDLVKYTSITEFVPVLKRNKKKKNALAPDFDEDAPLPFPPEKLYGLDGMEKDIRAVTVPWRKKNPKKNKRKGGRGGKGGRRRRFRH